MQMENNWKAMKEENGKQHNGQNMLNEPGQFSAQDIPNDDEQLTMRDLTVGYDRIPLIKNINLGVRPGEILTLIGPNGSGKSTILKTITKQLKTIGGSVFLGKESMRELTDSEISRHLSMVMTERIHTELLSGRDVVATGRYPYTGRLGIISQQDWKRWTRRLPWCMPGKCSSRISGESVMGRGRDLCWRGRSARTHRS